MSAFTVVTAIKTTPSSPGGDGVHLACGTAKGPSAAGALTGYDTGGSIVDMSAIFKAKCYGMIFYVDDATYRCIFVPAASYATATGKIFTDDNAGTEIAGTTDLSTDLATCHWMAWGTDA